MDMPTDETDPNGIIKVDTIEGNISECRYFAGYNEGTT